MTHTLRGEGPLDREVTRIRVRTPHSPEIAWLRSSMLPGLADCALRNGGRGLQLFETGRAFESGRETSQLGVMMIGAIDAPTWGGHKPAVADFFTLKGVLENVFHSLKLPFEPVASQDSRFHPTRQASVGGAGMFGQIHPDIQEQLGFAEPVFAAEIDLDALMGQAGASWSLKPISRNPAIRRDVAVMTPKTIAYADLNRAIITAGGEVLEKHWLFDVYEGKGVPEGSHSLAIALQLRKRDGTFTDEEANQVRDRIVAALTKAGATLR
jgi:phenylalanyl-tRNA synthetase beta chain